MQTHAGEFCPESFQSLRRRWQIFCRRMNSLPAEARQAALRVLTVYMAYAGKRLSASRRHSLERARDLLLERTRHALTDEQ